MNQIRRDYVRTAKNLLSETFDLLCRIERDERREYDAVKITTDGEKIGECESALRRISDAQSEILDAINSLEKT